VTGPSFSLESHSKAKITVRHIEQGHLFTFSLVDERRGKELSLANIRPGESGQHEADKIVGDAVAFAAEQARRLKLIW
jgi:hypothetical protein